MFHDYGGRTRSHTVIRNVARDYAVRAYDTPPANGDPFQNGDSGADPCPLANPNRTYVFCTREVVGDALFQGRWVAVIIRYFAITGNQHIVFDDYFAVARDGHIVSDKYAVADAKRGMIAEPAGGDGETAAAADIIADVEHGVSVDDRKDAQLKMLAYGFAAARE